MSKASAAHLTFPPERGRSRPQHVAPSRWSGAFPNLSTSYAAADRDGPRSGGGGFKMRPSFSGFGLGHSLVISHLSLWPFLPALLA